MKSRKLNKRYVNKSRTSRRKSRKIGKKLHKSRRRKSSINTCYDTGLIHNVHFQIITRDGKVLYDFTDTITIDNEMINKEYIIDIFKNKLLNTITLHKSSDYYSKIYITNLYKVLDYLKEKKELVIFFTNNPYGPTKESIKMTDSTVDKIKAIFDKEIISTQFTIIV